MTQPNYTTTQNDKRLTDFRRPYYMRVARVLFTVHHHFCPQGSLCSPSVSVGQYWPFSHSPPLQSSTHSLAGRNERWTNGKLHLPSNTTCKKKKNYSPTGNRTRVFRVTGGDTYHYTIEEHTEIYLTLTRVPPRRSDKVKRSFI